MKILHIMRFSAYLKEIIYSLCPEVISSCEYRRLSKKKRTVTVLYVKKDSQTYFSLMENSVVNVGKEEQRHRFKSL